jgi:RNA polymerase sigma factor (sigma-70 family)
MEYTSVHPTSPPIASARYDLNMTRLEDEPLVVLAAECDYRPARDELIRRVLPVADRLVGRYAARTGLQEADRQDARQDAVLWILEAVGRYRTDRTGKDGRSAGCPFRTFLRRVVSARLVDFLRRCRRLRRHFPLAEAALLDWNEDSYRPRHRSDPGTGGSAALPEREVEGGEVRAFLHRELGGFSEIDQTLWDLLAAGTPLRQVAQALNRSYHQVKRHRQKLIARLRCSLAGPRAADISHFLSFSAPRIVSQTN